MRPSSLSSIIIFWGCWLCGIYSRSLQDQVQVRGQSNYPAVGPYKGKIAFMFLARGELPHEDLWETFFSFHAPPSFFSIYWHTQPDYKPVNHSFFRPYQMKHLIPTQWGTMSLVEATRNMIRQAIKDPENKYFALFSESCIPLLPFSVWYRGMMQYADKYSLVNACDFGAKNMETLTRWRPDLDTVPGFSPEKFRKSAQWVALNRKHATIVANDAILAPKFHVVKPSDEHYVASLLALHNLDNETTCGDGFTHVVWPDLRSAHPATYSPDSLATFNAPPASFMDIDKVVPLLTPTDSVDIRKQREELIFTWREYEKHRDVFAHLRNTFTTFDIFNGRCAFHALSDAEQTIPLPHGAQWATSWPVPSDEVQRFAAGRHNGAPEYLKHVDVDSLVRNTRAFAQFVVSRGILPISQVPEPLRSQLVHTPSLYDGNSSSSSSSSGGGGNGSANTSAISHNHGSHSSASATALLTETLPCHFSGRKFAPSARFQLLAMIHLLFRDEAFQLSITPEEAFNRTVHRRLRFYRDPQNGNGGDTKVFLLDHHRLLHVPDVRFLLFPVPASVSHSTEAMMTYLSTVLPPLTPEEAAMYGGIANAASMFTLPEGTTVKYQRDPTVYLIQNFTRRVIPDFETFLANGLSPNEIRVLGPDDMQQILIGPMLPHKSASRKRRMSSFSSSSSLRGRPASAKSSSSLFATWWPALHGLFV